MSTVPDDAWRDAGLEDVEDTTSLLEEVSSPEEEPEETEEYRPRTPRPDLDGAANEADVVEQSQVVPELADDPEDLDYE
ncbi:hypothetical protein [Isoptericola variabilis]|uniref:Uncharacterized protein n=1 Tax=Isoptericola variabilis (strain 225) TaxID=743718 RepID=F6FPW6_ISOV2|nr:hypothetical protein [Isoptericola variabilis]AEG43755.1 hypothetical protein Isova_0971 [Isoptericola variabilis 225]TWH27435.1 hypothetical protein L600_000500001080 [Isoptericola variabilis J7]